MKKGKRCNFFLIIMIIYISVHMETFSIFLKVWISFHIDLNGQMLHFIIHCNDFHDIILIQREKTYFYFDISLVWFIKYVVQILYKKYRPIFFLLNLL